MVVNILNLINHAKPVAITPRYKSDNVEIIVGFEFHGVSINTDKGKRNITDHSVVEVVTFSFFLFLSFKVKRPPRH